MRWVARRDRKIKKILAKKDWHEWFAWYPVKLSTDAKNSETVWLETVYRRSKWPSSHHSFYNDYEIAEMRSKEWFSWYGYDYGDLMQIIVDSSNNR
jgi:hypothetical protein